jgi:hypothetical protein
MKRALVASLAALASFFAATPAFANYNDITLGTGTAVFSINGITLNVTGASDSVLESASADATTLSLSVPPNASFQVTAPGLNQITVNPQPLGTIITCTGILSQVAYSGTAATSTIVLTPSTNVQCVNNNSGSSGGGGGGSGSSVSHVVPPVLALGTPPMTPATFTRTLRAGSAGPDVASLQHYLNTHGFAIKATGTGSLGHESTHFGLATKAALMRFQSKNGIVPARGLFGPLTRIFIAAHP